MKTKKSLMFGILLLTFLFSISLVMGAITFNTPLTAGDTINGTYLFNITTDLTEPLNCTWSTTADGIFAITFNDTDGDTEFTNSTSTITLTEVEGTTLTVNCTNVSDDSQLLTLSINIDNTNPVCLFSTDSEITTYLNPIGISTTQLSTDTTDLNYSWVLYDPSLTSQQTSTSASPTFSGTDFDEKGIFILSLVVTDEASKTHACTNKSILVKGKDADDITAIITAQEERDWTLGIILGVIVAVLIIIILFFIIKYSKRR